MALEVAEISPADLGIKPPIDFEVWRNREQLDDEFGNTTAPILKPLKSVKITVGAEVKDFDSEIQQDFAYYSRTRALEINTPRTKLLQNLVDKMVAGTDIQTRVVIMNKGKGYDAFVTPEGTIFISQSILNALNSIDEIGAVLAHEVGHLHLRTFERIVKAGGFSGRFGIPWFHEGVSDSLAKEFGEKAGLNTFAFGTAIEKISGASRGIKHQGGYMRSSQNVAEHSARHYETSAKQVEPVPIMLHRKVRSTNLEIARDRIGRYQLTHLKEDLSKLHPADLEELYNKCLGQVSDDNRYEYDKQNYLKSLQVLDHFNQLLSDRLLQAGFSREQILTWLVTLSAHNRYLFKDSTDPIKVAQTIVVASSTGEQTTARLRSLFFFKEISQAVFEEGSYVSDAVEPFLSLLEKYLYDEFVGSVTGGIPVNSQSILETFKQLNILNLPFHQQPSVGKVLEAYIEQAFYKNATEAGSEIDTNQIVEFLDGAKEMGILNPEVPNGVITRASDQLLRLKEDFDEDSLIVRNYQQVVSTLRNYFGRKDWEPMADINNEIDVFFQKFSQEKEYYSWSNQISDFLYNLRKTFKHQNFSDADREKYIIYLSSKFDNWSGFTKYSVRSVLEKGEFSTKEAGDPEENARLARLKMRTVLGLALFKEDGEEFYRFLEEATKNSGIDLSSFSKLGLVNLSSVLFVAINNPSFIEGFFVPNQKFPQQSVYAPVSYVKIKNFEKLVRLSLISEILNRQEEEDLSSWDKLTASVVALRSKLDKNASECCYSRGGYTDIFTDNALTLVLFQNHRQAFLDFVSQGVKEEDLSSLNDALTFFFPADTRRDNFLRAIQKRFLLSESISLDQKTEYLLNNLESLGPEGVLMVADQIETLTDYWQFREKLGGKLDNYLNGGDTLLKGLAVDLVTSLLSGGYEDVIRTTIDDLKNCQES